MSNNIKIGSIVVRSKGWVYSNQDVHPVTKKQMSGVVIEESKPGWFVVKWENGTKNDYTADHIRIDVRSVIDAIMN